jgi:pentatricopeptide repeat protein
MEAGYWEDKRQALCRLGRYDEALQAYEQAISFNMSRSVTYLAQMGHVLRDASRLEDALRTYEWVLERDPSAVAWGDKGLALRGLGCV